MENKHWGDIIGEYVVLLAKITIGIIARGFLIFKYSQWFLEPFFGIDALTMVQSCALWMVVSTFKNVPSQEKKDKRSNEESFINTLGFLILMLFIGFLTSQTLLAFY